MASMKVKCNYFKGSELLEVYISANIIESAISAVWYCAKRYLYCCNRNPINLYTTTNQHGTKLILFQCRIEIFIGLFWKNAADDTDSRDI